MVGGLATDFEIGRGSFPNGHFLPLTMWVWVLVCTASHLLVVARGYMCDFDRFLFSAIMETGNHSRVIQKDSSSAAVCFSDFFG